MEETTIFFGLFAVLVVVIILGAWRLQSWVAGQRARQLGLHELMHRLGLSEQEWKQIAPPTYREQLIPKRSGGSRKLEIPDPATLAIQRRILRRVLNRLNSHPAAVGFEPGKNIVDAAIPHRGRKVIIRIDIRNFFETTTEERIGEWFRWIGWDEEATEFLLMMVTYQGHLPQGAPTSPRLSNLVNARLDAGLQSLAGEFAGRYTRYADDITMSFDVDRGRFVRSILQIARRILRQAGYQMNGRKTRILRAHQQQLVLGLTVNDKVAIPRHVRRRLRAARHRVANGKQSTLSPTQLQGWTAFETMVTARQVTDGDHSADDERDDKRPS